LGEFSMATNTTDEVLDAQTGPTETTDEVMPSATRPAETSDEVVVAEPPATETTDEVVTSDPGPTETSGKIETTERRSTDKNDAKTKTRPMSDEIAENDTRQTDTSAEVEQTERRPDLIWDAGARGLCVRSYGDGSKSFIFVYRIHNRQHFIRIGKTPIWSLEADRAKKLRSILNQGDDPARYQKQNNVAPVENLIQYIAEQLRTNP